MFDLATQCSHFIQELYCNEIAFTFTSSLIQQDPPPLRTALWTDPVILHASLSPSLSPLLSCIIDRISRFFANNQICKWAIYFLQSTRHLRKQAAHLSHDRTCSIIMDEEQHIFPLATLHNGVTWRDSHNLRTAVNFLFTLRCDDDDLSLRIVDTPLNEAHTPCMPA